MNSDTPAAPRTSFLTNRRLGWLFVVTALVSAVTFFVADNFVIVEVRVFTFDFNVRLAWVMLICLLVGMALGWLLHWLWGRNRS